MINYLLTDIETVANERAKAYFEKKTYEAPANWKDPEKIASYQLEARHKDIQKAALSWFTGKIVCIGTRTLDGIVKTFVGPDEAKVLEAFFDYLVGLPTPPTFIGKNSETFDKPYLIGRALAHSLGLPQPLRAYRPVEDLDQIFGWSNASTQRGSLQDYAFGLGIEGKSGHGTDVQSWYDAAVLGGDQKAWNLIATYCNQDNAIAGELLTRYLKVYKAPEKVKAAKPQAVPELAAVPPPKPQVVDGVEIPFEPPKELGTKPKNKGGRPRKHPKPEAIAQIVPDTVLSIDPEAQKRNEKEMLTRVVDAVLERKEPETPAAPMSAAAPSFNEMEFS